MRLRTAAVLALTLLIPASALSAQSSGSGITSGHVHINVTDVDLHKRLWVDHFDGELVERGSLAAIRWPGLLLVLHERQPTGGSQGTTMDHVGLKVRSMQTVLDRWRAAGLEVTGEFIGAEGYPNAYVAVPDGVRLELQEDPSLPFHAIGYHVHWITPDFEDILAWYVDTFSLRQRDRGDITTTTDIPGMNLSFGSADQPTAPSRGRAIDRVGFEVDDLDGLVSRLERQGVDFGMGVHDAPGGAGIRHAFFTDPSGVTVELSEGYDEL